MVAHVLAEVAAGGDSTKMGQKFREGKNPVGVVVVDGHGKGTAKSGVAVPAVHVRTPCRGKRHTAGPQITLNPKRS